MSSSLEDQRAQFDQAKDTQEALLKKTLQEKEKRIELLQFEMDEQIRMNNQKYEEDIKQLQQQLADSYKEKQNEIEGYLSQMHEMKSQLNLKKEYAENLQQENSKKSDMVSQHNLKLQEILR